MKSFGITDGDAHDVLLDWWKFTKDSVKTSHCSRSHGRYLNRKRITYKKIESGIYQLDFIPKEELEFLLDNFDVIQKIQSLYTTRVQPNNFGEPERVSDATLNLLEGAPTIGVIDTGVQRLAVLNPILERDGFDLVDKDTPHPYEIDLRSEFKSWLQPLPTLSRIRKQLLIVTLMPTLLMLMQKYFLLKCKAAKQGL